MSDQNESVPHTDEDDGLWLWEHSAHYTPPTAEQVEAAIARANAPIVPSDRGWDNLPEDWEMCEH